MNNQSVSREYSYFQAWINVPLDKHTTLGNWLEEPAPRCPRRELGSYMTPATLFIRIDGCVVYALSTGPCTLLVTLWLTLKEKKKKFSDVCL